MSEAVKAADGTPIAERCIMDFPEAFKFIEESAPDKETHHPKCSYRQAGMLCDCSIIWAEYHKRRANQAEQRERVLNAKLLLWESEGISALRAADKMAEVCDDWVRRGLIDARSAFADARLVYCDPYTFKWPVMKAELGALATPAQPQEHAE